ncbi:MAG: tripartite tricarboxylate transporter substrate binding protein [Burkholderiaceae bacterium]
MAKNASSVPFPAAASRRRRLLAGGLSGLGSLAFGAAYAQGSARGSYPDKPVHILVGFAAGGGIDIMARIVAKSLTEQLGQPFVVENRPGASGIIAAGRVAKSSPDGVTLLVTADVHLIAPTLTKEVPYDPLKDFAAVGTLASGPQCIAVHPGFAAQTLPALIESAKARPGALAYASGGGGTLTHMAMELFCTRAGIRMLHIPHKGSGPSLMPVMAGDVPVLSISLGSALPHAKSGKLRILAVTSAQRTPLAPEIPTVAESAGLSGFEASSWMGVLAPAGTPPPVVSLLNAEIEKLLQRRDVQEQLAINAWVANPQSPQSFSDMLARDMAKWTALVRDTGIKAD